MAKERIPYFRFYPEAFMGGVRGMSAQEVGLYVMLLCRMYEENGPIENHPMRLATYTGMRVATFEKALEKLIMLGKIVVTDGRLFNDRAEREIAKRADDLEIASRGGKASAQKRQQNQGANATPVQPPFNHKDLDREVVKTEANASAKKRGTRLPDDWFLPRAWGQWAVEQGVPSDKVRNEADRFRDWWVAKAGAGGVKLDWEATWRNWIRKWLDDNRKELGNGNAKASARLAAFMAAAEPPRMGIGQDRDPSQPLLARR